jgi:CheY-like chemotaxis protein
MEVFMEQGKKVVIFLDDSPTARMVVQEELDSNGYISYSAGSPSELESLLSKNRRLLTVVDLLVLDLSMPEMIGTQVGSTFPMVFKELEGVPFVIYSGEPQDRVKKSIEEGYEYFGDRFYKNFAGYVEKGEGSIKVLMAKIKDLFAKRK